jgi:hypothetical protein
MSNDRNKSGRDIVAAVSTQRMEQILEELPVTATIKPDGDVYWFLGLMYTGTMR